MSFMLSLASLPQSPKKKREIVSVIAEIVGLQIENSMNQNIFLSGK